MKTKENQLVTGRREALKIFGLGSAALLMGDLGRIPSIATYEMAPKKNPVVPAGRSKVAFTSGTDRRAMIFEVMEPFKDKIRKDLKGKQLVIKPNMVSTKVPLCATHVDAIRGLLEYITPIYNGQVIIAEASNGETTPGFENYGYLTLQKDYDIKFIDLNKTNGNPIWILDNNLYPQKIQVASMFLDPGNYIISISRLKTHNAVIMTAGTKNMVMAAPIIIYGVDGQKPLSYKRMMHGGGSRWLHYNMFQVAQHVHANFTIIDGVEGMEGNGPSGGTAVDHRIALAGEDALAIDSLCAKLMGIPLEDLGYLQYCAADGLGIIDREKIDIIGSKDPDKYVIPYKLHENIATQLQWKEPLIPAKK